MKTIFRLLEFEKKIYNLKQILFRNIIFSKINASMILLLEMIFLLEWFFI